jgi:hypothetical protein
MFSGEQQPEARRNGPQIGDQRFQKFAPRFQASAARLTRLRFRGAKLLPARFVNNRLTFNGHL